MDYLLAVIMGVVEGITEFLPVSSTGHLILTEDLLGFAERVGKDFSDTFVVVIQLGAILSIPVAFPGRFTALADLRRKEGFAGLRGLSLLVITSIPAGLLGLAAQKYIKAHLFNATTVTLALAVGAIWILIVERVRPRPRIEGLDALTWRQALAIGLFQCLSLWPGMSRSASTILGGMLVGVDRKTATEYSFFAAVPIMIAATGWELRHATSLSGNQWTILAIGFVVSFFAAWAAVRVFVQLVGRSTLVGFGWYRLAVAAVFAALVLTGWVTV
jgi:undecaprenyl-diphosphatase